MKLTEYLKQKKASPLFLEWVEGKDFPTAWRECKQGDWMLWLAQEAELCDLRTLTLMKARCAELARPYMKNKFSIIALDAATDFAIGKIDRTQLAYYYYYAYVSILNYEGQYNPSDAAARYAAVAAASTTEYAAKAAEYAALAAARDNTIRATSRYRSDIYEAQHNASAAVLARCADICREVLPTPHFKF
jgi:hypothetical protein